MVRKAWFFFLLISASFWGPVLTVAAQDEDQKIILIVDASRDGRIAPVVTRILGELGATVVPFGTPGENLVPVKPLVEDMQRYFATVWFTSGKFDEIDGKDARIISKYLQTGGRLLLMGSLTGDALSWNFVDKDCFGFMFQGTTDYPLRVEETFGGWGAEIVVDYGLNMQGGCPLYFIHPTFQRDRNLAMKPCGVGFVRDNGSRSVWLGFNFQDLRDEALQKKVLSNTLWFFDYFNASTQLLPLPRQEELFNRLHDQAPRRTLLK